MENRNLCVVVGVVNWGFTVLAISGAVLVGSLDVADAQDSVPNAFSVRGKDFTCEFQPENSRLECKSLTEKKFEGVETIVLEDPDRLVIDIPNVAAGKPQSTMVNSSLVVRIRSAQRGSGARVVLDLRRPTAFMRYESSNGTPLISLELSQTGTEPPPPAEMTTPQTTEEVSKPDPKPNDITDSTEQTEASLEPKKEILPQLPNANLTIPRDALEPDSVLLFSVSTTFLSFEPGERPIKDVQVVNKTEKELFLRTDVQRVYDSGTPAERYENTKVIVASPKRFALPPLATRSVRLVVSGDLPQSSEEIYRMILSPEELPDAQVEIRGQLNQQAARFKVVAGLGVTISLPSSQAQGLIRLEPQVNQIVLVNTGSRSVLIENCSACPLNRDTCASSGRKLLYPQRPWSIPVTGSGVINCDVVIGKDKTQLSSVYNAKESE